MLLIYREKTCNHWNVHQENNISALHGDSIIIIRNGDQKNWKLAAIKGRMETDSLHWILHMERTDTIRVPLYTSVVTLLATG